MVNNKLIKVIPNDIVFLRTEFKKRLRDKFPELDGVVLTDAFLIHKLVTALKGEWEL